MFNLSGKTALVTGSSRGIGRGIALMLAQAGADIVVNYVSSEEEANLVVQKITQMGRKSIAVKADVSNKVDVDFLFEQIHKTFKSLDVLVNNAGINHSKDIFETEKEDWDKIIAANQTSGFLCSKKSMEIMRKQNYGRIIFISSVVAERGALFGHVHYAATKAAQLGMTKTLARTGAPYNITVNAIAPGIIKTDLLYKTHGNDGVNKLVDSVPLGLGKSEDIGAATVFLASDEAGYITGATIDVNGGINFR